MNTDCTHDRPWHCIYSFLALKVEISSHVFHILSHVTMLNLHLHVRPPIKTHKNEMNRELNQFRIISSEIFIADIIRIYQNIFHTFPIWILLASTHIPDVPQKSNCIAFTPHRHISRNEMNL